MSTRNSSPPQPGEGKAWSLGGGVSRCGQRGEAGGRPLGDAKTGVGKKGMWTAQQAAARGLWEERAESHGRMCTQSWGEKHSSWREQGTGGPFLPRNKRRGNRLSLPSTFSLGKPCLPKKGPLSSTAHKQT